MSIKTTSIGSLPAVELDHIQYTQFRMSVGESEPHRVSVSAVLRPYGVYNGIKFYSKDSTDLQITDLDKYISELPAEKQASAVSAMVKVQEGLGELAATHLNITFVGVE